MPAMLKDKRTYAADVPVPAANRGVPAALASAVTCDAEATRYGRRHQGSNTTPLDKKGSYPMRKRLVEAALEAGRFALFGIVFVAVLGGLFLQSEGDLTYVTLAAAALGSLFISYLALMLLINSTGHNREVVRLLRVIAEEPPQDDVPTPSPRPARRKSRTLLAFLSGVAVGLLAVAALYVALLEADWAVGLWLPPLVVFLLVLVMSGIVYLLRRDNDARGLDGR